MGKIYYLIGKSASGKDSLLSCLMSRADLSLKKIVQTTTRPMRDGEAEGREYYFISTDQARQLKEDGKVIEQRVYHTVYGDWIYMLADNGAIDLRHNDYAAVGTVESYVQVRDYFGEEKVVPVFIYVEAGERLQRALTRERMHDHPKYTEMCRRFIADEADFDDAHMKAAGLMNGAGEIRNCFENTELSDTADRIAAFILKEKAGGGLD